MILHALACATWLLLHLLVAGVWRPALATRLGEHGFRALFSLLSAISLGLMIWTYTLAPKLWLWLPSAELNAIAVMIMALAFFLMVAALRPANPTLAGADMFLKDRLPVSGITRVTRHPGLWAFVLWAVAHAIANGDLATQLLCAAIGLTALNGMWSIDRKKRRRFGAAYAEFEARTSIVPFAAIVQGRNEFRAGEIGWIPFVVAVLAFAATWWLHGKLGVPITF